MTEHALMLMLVLARGLPGMMRARAQRVWRVPDGAGQIVAAFGKIVRNLGVGAIGSHRARRCRVGLGMRVLGTARTHRDDPHVERYIGTGYGGSGSGVCRT